MSKYLGLLCALAACGDVSHKPDASTDTTAPTTSASPEPGVSRTPPQVTLTSNEPATVYYTTDGSEPSDASPHGDSPLAVTGLVAGTPLEFYAIDAAGNQEATHSVVYTVDRLGPVPLDNFRAVPSGTDV